MAFRFQLGKQRAVSFVLKDHVIRFVETKNLPEIQVQKWGERYLPAGIIKEGKILDRETLIIVLEECVADWKLKNRTVSFLVPDQYTVLRKLKVPADVKEDEIRGYLFMELGTSIHLPFEDPVFDFHLLPESQSSQKEILLFATPEETVQDYSDVFEEAKLKPAAADVSSLALYRLYDNLNHDKTNENLLMIQFDLTTVNVSIFENHQPVFIRHLLMDVDMVKWEYPKQGENDGRKPVYSGDSTDVRHSLKDIYSEIDKVMNFYRYSLNQGKQQITKIFIDGDHPWFEEIFAEIKDRLDVPVVKLANQLLQTNGEIRNLSSFHLNIGLALKEV